MQNPSSWRACIHVDAQTQHLVLWGGHQMDILNKYPSNAVADPPAAAKPAAHL